METTVTDYKHLGGSSVLGVVDKNPGGKSISGTV